jgi:lipopolysaccharide exporter
LTTELARRAGGALIWRGLALVGEKLIFLARLLILARLLAPEDFGLVAIGMVALVMALSLSDFGVVAALIQQPAAGKRHLDTAWTINLLRGIGVTIALFVLAPWIASGFGEPRATEIIRALALTALLQAAGSIQVAKLNRELKFRGLATIRLAAAVLNTVVAIALAPSQGAWALVWGAIAGALAHLVVSYMVAPYRPGLRLSDKATAGIARFGRWIFLVGVLSVVSDSLIRWIVATRLGVLELGLFFMAMRLAYLPAQMISEIVSEVAFPVYAELQGNRAKAALAFRGLLVSVAALLVPVCLVFAWLVPEIVQSVLGARWQESGAVMQWLILGSVVGLLSESVVPVLKGVGRPAGIVTMDVVQLVLLVALGWPLIGVLGLAGAGVAWLLAILASQLLAVRYARALFGTPFEGLAVPLLAVLASALAATVTAGVVLAVLPGLAGLASAIALSAAVAGGVTLFLDRRLDLGILRTLAGPFPWLQRLLPGATTA